MNGSIGRKLSEQVNYAQQAQQFAGANDYCNSGPPLGLRFKAQGVAGVARNIESQVSTLKARLFGAEPCPDPANALKSTGEPSISDWVEGTAEVLQRVMKDLEFLLDRTE